MVVPLFKSSLLIGSLSLFVAVTQALALDPRPYDAEGCQWRANNLFSRIDPVLAGISSLEAGQQEARAIQASLESEIWRIGQSRLAIVAAIRTYETVLAALVNQRELLNALRGDLEPSNSHDLESWIRAIEGRLQKAHGSEYRFLVELRSALKSMVQTTGSSTTEQISRALQGQEVETAFEGMDQLRTVDADLMAFLNLRSSELQKVIQQIANTEQLIASYRASIAPDVARYNYLKTNQCSRYLTRTLP